MPRSFDEILNSFIVEERLKERAQQIEHERQQKHAQDQLELNANAARIAEQRRLEERQKSQERLGEGEDSVAMVNPRGDDGLAPLQRPSPAPAEQPAPLRPLNTGTLARRELSAEEQRVQLPRLGAPAQVLNPGVGTTPQFDVEIGPATVTPKYDVDIGPAKVTPADPRSAVVGGSGSDMVTLTGRDGRPITIPRQALLAMGLGGLVK